MSIFSWLKRRKKWINKTEQITTMENLLKCDGRRFRAKIYGTICEGNIKVLGDTVYLYQNIAGTKLNKKQFGYERCVGVGIGDENSLAIGYITNFHLLPRSAAEIEAYKDWQVGDKVTDGGRVWEVIFRSGELVVCKKECGRATTNYTCDELYSYGFRLVADPEPEDETVELTMDEIAEKFGIKPENLRIKKEE